MFFISTKPMLQLVISRRLAMAPEKPAGLFNGNGVKMKVGSGNDHKDRFFLIISEQI